MRFTRMVVLCALALTVGAVTGQLSDELKAQTRPDSRELYDREQIACITEAIYYEGRSDLPGVQIMQVMTILARSKDPQWPGTPCAVIRQPGAFSYYYDDKVRYAPLDSVAWARAARIAKETYEEAWKTQLLPHGGECMRNYRLSDKVLAQKSRKGIRQLHVSKRSLNYFENQKLVLTVGQHSFYALAHCKVKLPTT